MDKHILRLYIYFNRKAAALFLFASTFLYVLREDAVAQQATIAVSIAKLNLGHLEKSSYAH